ERSYFDFFFDVLAHNKAALCNEMRDAYAADYKRPEALKAGFDWYRGFAQDEKDNAGAKPINVPLLYVRGEYERGDIQKYIDGFKCAGVTRVQSAIIPDAGHFTADENPAALASRLRAFMDAL